MRTLRLLVEYDGTNYVGWQRQREGASIQGALEDALRAMLGLPATHPLSVRGAGRTDAGVHAEGQVAAVDLDDAITVPALGFQRGLNAHLPPDIAVLSVQDAAPGFNPRRAARGKLYRYRIWNHDTRSPLHGRYTWHVRGFLDMERMREGAALLQGEHDFRGFRAADCERRTTRRLLRRVDARRQGALITVDVEGTAFLKHMVRILTGTLVQLAQGRLTLDEVRAVLEHGDRTRAGVTAPAQGLTLVRVDL